MRVSEATNRKSVVSFHNSQNENQKEQAILPSGTQWPSSSSSSSTSPGNNTIRRKTWSAVSTAGMVQWRKEGGGQGGKQGREREGKRGVQKCNSIRLDTKTVVGAGRPRWGGGGGKKDERNSKENRMKLEKNPRTLCYEYTCPGNDL